MICLRNARVRSWVGDPDSCAGGPASRSRPCSRNRTRFETSFTNCISWVADRGYLLVQPDQKRPAPPQGIVVGLPVRRAVAGRFRLCHARTLNLPDWRRESSGSRVLQQRRTAGIRRPPAPADLFLPHPRRARRACPTPACHAAAVGPLWHPSTRRLRMRRPLCPPPAEDRWGGVRRPRSRHPPGRASSVRSDPRRGNRVVIGQAGRRLRADGVGMQGHIGIDYPGLDEYEAAIEAYHGAGVKVMVTELDISALPSPWGNAGANISDTITYRKEENPYPNGLPRNIQSEWEKRYTDFFALFLKHHDKISRVTLWGVSDIDSWKNDFPVKGRTDYPLLFDRQYKAKPVVGELIKMAEEN